MSNSSETPSTESKPASPAPVAPKETPAKDQKRPAAPVRKVGEPINPPEPPAPDPFEPIFNKALERAKATGTDLTKELVSFMQKYVVDMKYDQKNEMDPNKGAAYQKNFCRMIMKVIEKSTGKVIIDGREQDEFRQNWIVLLTFFWFYRKGALGPKEVNRFAANWQNADEGVTIFQRLVNLCLLSANPADRPKTLKQADILRTLDLGLTQEGKERVIGFYRSISTG